MAKRLSISFQTRSFDLSEDLRERALSSLESGLALHRHRVGRVLVQLAAPGQDPRGKPVDARCAIHLEVMGHGHLSAQSRAADLHDALWEAIARSRSGLDRMARPEFTGGEANP